MKIRPPLLYALLVVCSSVLIVVIAIIQFKTDAIKISEVSDVSSVELVEPISNEPIQPISAYTMLDENKVALGELLFNDRRLSVDDSISCANCHDLNLGGADGLPRSPGVNGNIGDINSPTVFNSGLNIAQFWDGRAETLHDQIDGPTHNPKEMGSSWPQIVGKLDADETYQTLFNLVYSDGMNSHNIKDAIASFERSLVTINSPFDRYLRGDVSAISEDAKAGYQIFKEYGCISCHQGSNVGGNVFQKFGIMGDYFSDRDAEVNQVDLGRYNVTGLEEDKNVFRVPSLRLVSLTAPYFHDGSVAELQDAVSAMIEYQLGRTSTDKDEELIVEFLHSLVGEYNGKRLGQ